MKYDTIVIGGGVAGFGAAVYCGRFCLKTLVIGEKLGGTIISADYVTNYPGFKKITGLELFEKIKTHAQEYGITIVEEMVTKVEKSNDGCFRVFAGNKMYTTKTIIFATGTEQRKLNVPGEKEFAGKGVHYCALCDGVLYKNRIIGVVGGSDSAIKEALLLAEYCKRAYIIYRGGKIRAEPINLKMVMENKKIEIITSTIITEVKGDKFVTSVTLDKPYKGLKELKLDALFIEIGHMPLSRLAKDIGIKLNEKGEVIVDKNSKTNVQGIFAAGDVVNSKFKQAITGVAEGIIAAYSAYNYINQYNVIFSYNNEE